MRPALVAVFVSLLAILPCRGRAPLPPPPGPQRLGPLDAVVVGRVVAFEDQDIEASPYPKAEKITYRVAVVTVTQGSLASSDPARTSGPCRFCSQSGCPEGVGGFQQQEFRPYLRRASAGVDPNRQLQEKS